MGPDGKPAPVGQLGTQGLNRKPSFASRAVSAGVGACRGCATSPIQLHKFLHMLFLKFGFYVPTAVMLYGLNQGIGFSLGRMAGRVLYSNILKVDGARAADTLLRQWCPGP